MPMESTVSPPKKLRSPAYDGVNTKTSVTCNKVPESLFDASAAKKHFSKFGRVQKIKLFPKRHMCIIEYDQPLSMQRAVLNAGAYDGFMFDVSRTKPRVRRKSKKEDDPDWLPDSDVEKELTAMGATSSYRVSRQKPMDIQSEDGIRKNKPLIGTFKRSPVRKTTVKEKSHTMQQSGIESPIPTSVSQTSLSTTDAARELHQLRSKIALSPEEQWRLLDARDKILRSWGGAGSRVKVGGATIGTCPDMCPEKERLHRQSEYQVMTLEAEPNSDGQLEPRRAVKQYSRSSADQEMPMCYELRSASVLLRTCAYLLHEIADTTQQVSLADWFHFMWDRLRGIRKDITQQALCCSESIQLVEMCARFHAHCAARLADLEHGQFDQKLNTDNLTKCLQTLKHMYADVPPSQKPREAEFRGYIALLNLGDANFWWEIKQLPREIQKSEDILFAIQVFNTLDNNNYVRFFRLVKKKATYLQACILLRYFNDVRAKALARVVKAYAPRGGSKYPAQDLMNALSFESFDHLKSFVSHYGLHFGKTDESELTIILDRNQFIEDSNPYPISRAKILIESKRQCTVGEVIAGGPLQNHNYNNHILYSSFNKDGTLKETALIAEDQGYNTINDSNKNIQALKTELQQLLNSGRNAESLKKTINPKDTLHKVDFNLVNPREPLFPGTMDASDKPKIYSFNPAIPVAPAQDYKDSPQKIFGDRSHVFSFSKPQESSASLTEINSMNIFKSLQGQNKVFDKSNNSALSFPNIPKSGANLFRKPDIESKNLFSNSDKPFTGFKASSIDDTNIFSKPIDALDGKQGTAIISGSIFSKSLKPNEKTVSGNIFSAVNSKPTFSSFSKSADTNNKPMEPNGDITHKKLSPSSLFKSATNFSGPETKNYSIFQSKNVPSSVANNIFKSIQTQSSKVYEFDENTDETKRQLELKHINEAKIIEEHRKEEEMKQVKRQEEKRRKEEMQKRQEELKRLEEQRKKEDAENHRKEEEKKQEELRKKLEEDKKAEQRRKAEEDRKFKERVEKESIEVTDKIIDHINDEVVNSIMKEEMERFEKLMSSADNEIEEILIELCNEICYSEIKAEKIWSEKLMKKWFHLWRTQFMRNQRRRNLLDDTPIWLTNDVPVNTAFRFRRQVEKSALLNMNAIHKGYRFTGELKQLPVLEPYNIMEIIRSPLLKRMKQICYPYDKCFFWKVTLVLPGDTKWLYRKIDVEKWLIDRFSDKKEHDVSKKLLYVQKQSWNNLMNFVISVSLISENNNHDVNEAMEGTNGMLFYDTENKDFTNVVEKALQHKYPYQCIPVAVIMPKICDLSKQRNFEQFLTALVNKRTISDFRIFFVDSKNLFDSLNVTTKSALKWLAKKFPPNPPLEIDYLKSLCQRCLVNEIWNSLKSRQDNRTSVILKDFRKLIECYNKSLEKLTEIITNEDLFNYPTFPLEFNVYLNNTLLYPKPYEFITSKVKTAVNILNIKAIMEKLKLPVPESQFLPVNVNTLQEQIRSYCKQIGWFKNSEEVVCKVIAVMPNVLNNFNVPPQEFSNFFEQYDLVDILNIVIHEKINSFDFNNLFVVYDKTVMANYHSYDWLFETNIFTSIKHKIIQDDDDIDLFIETKRQRLALDSINDLMLEENDQTLVEKSINFTEKSIAKYSDCKMAVEHLEEKIEEERKKSIELENLLKTALLGN